jgi:hypothetical protein
MSLVISFLLPISIHSTNALTQATSIELTQILLMLGGSLAYGQICFVVTISQRGAYCHELVTETYTIFSGINELENVRK